MTVFTVWYGLNLYIFFSSILVFNLLKTKRKLLYTSNQSVPRCKHFPPRL